jgi:hypothetical protein
MLVSVVWHTAIPLHASDKFIYWCDIERLPEKPGVYVFARQWGHRLVPMYVGKAGSIRTRVVQHLRGNVRLMRAIEKEDNGRRVVFAGELERKQGVKIDSAIHIIETALMSKLIEDGYDLLNSAGTKRPHHKLEFSGSMPCRRLSGQRIEVEA